MGTTKTTAAATAAKKTTATKENLNNWIKEVENHLDFENQYSFDMLQIRTTYLEQMPLSACPHQTFGIILRTYLHCDRPSLCRDQLQRSLYLFKLLIRIPFQVL